MFIVKNETFTGLILIDGLAPCTGVPSKCVILGFWGDQICQQRVLAPWLLLKQDILSEARVY